MPGMVIVVRSSGLPSALETAARSFSESIDPKLLPEMHPLKNLYQDITLQIEQISAVVSLIGIVAVVLAGIGIVGLVAFSVSQRTKEMAIRLALGATKRRLCAALLRQFTWPILSGLLAGTALAAFASRFLRVALFGVSNLDPLGYAAALAVLIAIIAVAGLLPARRALRLDVARALHYQ